MVKPRVSLLVFHGVPSTFMSSARLEVNNESPYDGSSRTSNLFPFPCFFNKHHKFISIAFPFLKIHICLLENQPRLNVKF